MADYSRSKIETDGMVDKWYEMDPDTEDLLYDGGELMDGMFVLLENPEMRVDVREELTDEELFRARRTNRWMQISRVKVTDKHVSFMAEFEDGVKSKLEFPVDESWIVKDFPSPSKRILEVNAAEEVARGMFQVPGQTVIGVATVQEKPHGLEIDVEAGEKFNQASLNKYLADRQREAKGEQPWMTEEENERFLRSQYETRPASSESPTPGTKTQTS